MVKVRILIVEDEIIVAKDIQNTLEKLGYNVTAVVTSGRDAIEQIEKVQPDLVLMDIVLKGSMDGIEAAEQIHTRFNIPVVYLTAYADNKTLQRAKITAPFGYILKPFEERELYTTIEMALYKHRLENELKEREAFNFALFEYNPIQTIVVDNEGKVTGFNLAKKKSGDRLPNIGDVMYKHYAANHEIDMYDEMMECMRSGEIKKFPEQKYGNKILSITISPFSRGAIITSEDITKRKKTEKKLHRVLKELQAKRQRMMELAKRTIDLQEKERLYLASEIHDDLLQNFVAILYFLQMMDTSKLDKTMRTRKEKLIKIIKSSIDRGRALISEIEPIREPEIGLPQVIQKSIDLGFDGTNAKVKFTYPKKFPKMNFTAKANILRIVQEALMNIRKHAHASKISVKISLFKKRLKVTVEDNGVGFTPDIITKKNTGHYGLLTMQERAHLIGGELNIESKPGCGTIVVLIGVKS